MHNLFAKLGSKCAFSVISIHIMNKLKLDSVEQINGEILPRFLERIGKGYNTEVQYHNAMHAADVLQMAYLILTQGEFRKFGALTDLDTLSVVVASVCHDYGHDGLNNAYHVNAITERAIRYSDVAVQENYHVSESFAIINDTKYNFLTEYSRDDFKVFRKRMIGIILATDMARHVTDLS